MDIKKCDGCGGIQGDHDDPMYEWWSVTDGLERAFSTSMRGEVCSKACAIEWIEWRLRQRAEAEQELEETSA